jgi:hypothetical protein
MHHRSLEHGPLNPPSYAPPSPGRVPGVQDARAPGLIGWLLVALLLASTPMDAQTVAFNEIMASNGFILADENGDFEDWIEFHNHGDAPVDLEGFGLSDTAKDPFRWTFPPVTIQPGQFRLVWASGKDRRNPNAPLHANFAISASGERLLLTRPDGFLVDEFPPTPIGRNQSMGRVPDGTGDWFYFKQPTPLGPNLTTPYSGVLPAPRLSVPSGFHADSIQVIVSHDRIEDAQLRYTLDGSEPGPNSPLVPGSLVIPVHPRVGEPNVFSSIKTTAGGDFWRNPNYDVPKATVLRVRAYSVRDEMPSPTITRSYFVGSHLKNRYTFPVISIVTDGANLFDDHIGIYVAGAGYDGNWQNSNYWKRGEAWERPVHLEIFEPDGSLALAQDAGVRVHGGWSRRWAFKSLRFYARSDYGENSFQYRLFPHLPHDSYRRFIIRNSGNDHDATLFRDAFMQRLVEHMRFDTQAYRAAIIFINGEYWGIQNMRERYDRHYLERTHGVDPDNVDLLTNHRQVKEGSASHYDQMRLFIERRSVVANDALARVASMMDLDNFIDYQVAQIYLNNTDWPGNNIDFWRLRTDDYQPDAAPGHDGRWRWMVFDTDFGFWLYNAAKDQPTHNAIAFATAAGGNSWPNPDWSTFLLRSLLQNELFRVAFINRFADQLNTAFLPQRAVSMINEMATALQPEIGDHILRFGRPSSFTSWGEHVQRMRAFATQRPGHQFDHIQSHFNLPGTYRLTVEVDNPDTGRIRVNSILIDPSTPGVRPPPYPWTGRYFHSVPLEIEAIPAPGYRFARWISEDLDTQDSATLALLPPVSHPSAQTVALTAVFEPSPPDPEWITFRAWMKQHGFSDADLDDPLLGAPEADPDVDGLPNLLEYALDGDPMVPHTATTPRIEVTGSSVIMLFPQDPAKSDLAWIVQASTDLVNWDQIVYDSRLQPALHPNDPIARVDLDTADPPSDQLQRFFRLQILLLDP